MEGRANINLNLPRDQVVRIVSLIEDGRSQRYVANLVGVNQSTVSRVVARYHETGGYQRRAVPGRPHATTPADNRFLLLQALRQRHITATQLQYELAATRNVRVSSETVRHILRQSGIRARVAVTAPRLTREHRVARLAFAREHMNWNINDWGNVLFTDESRFCLYTSDRRIPVYRRDGERYFQCNIRPSTNFGGGSIMLWGGIASRAHTDLVRLDRGSLNADRYIRDILEPHVVPYAPFVGDNFLLMHDNARPHVARIVTDYLQEVNIRVLDWPACSPDLNPIEHVWDYLYRRVRAGNILAANLEELYQHLNAEWQNMDQVYLETLIRSMPERCQDVIRARGGNTRF